MPTCMRACVHTCMRACTELCVRTCVRAHLWTCVMCYMCACDMYIHAMSIHVHPCHERSSVHVKWHVYMQAAAHPADPKTKLAKAWPWKKQPPQETRDMHQRQPNHSPKTKHSCTRAATKRRHRPHLNQARTCVSPERPMPPAFKH